jgi:hypothetical protein
VIGIGDDCVLDIAVDMGEGLEALYGFGDWNPRIGSAVQKKQRHVDFGRRRNRVVVLVVVDIRNLLLSGKLGGLRKVN